MLRGVHVIATNLKRGQVAFLGCNTGDDGISIVFLADIAAGTEVYITGRSWDGTAFGPAGGGADTLTLTIGPADFSAGLIVSFNAAQLASAGIDLTDAGGTLYVYQGSGPDTPTTFLYALDFGDGDASFDASLANTGLSVADGSAAAIGEDNAAFAGRGHNIAPDLLLQDLADSANWISSDARVEPLARTFGNFIVAPDRQVWVAGAGDGNAIVTLDADDASILGGNVSYRILQRLQGDPSIFHPNDIALDTVHDRFFFVDSDDQGHNRLIQGSISQMLNAPDEPFASFVILYSDDGTTAPPGSHGFHSLSVDSANGLVYFDHGATFNRVAYDMANQTPALLADLGTNPLTGAGNYISQVTIDYAAGTVYLGTNTVDGGSGSDRVSNNRVFMATGLTPASVALVFTPIAFADNDATFNPDPDLIAQSLGVDHWPVERGTIQGVDVDPTTGILYIATGTVRIDTSAAQDGSEINTFPGGIWSYDPVGGTIANLYAQAAGAPDGGPAGLLHYIEVDATAGQYYVVDTTGTAGAEGDGGIWIGSLSGGTPSLFATVGSAGGLAPRGLEIQHAPTLSGTSLDPTITEAAGDPSPNPTAVTPANGFSAGDSDSGGAADELAGAQVRISANFQSGPGHQDQLLMSSFTSGDTQNGAIDIGGDSVGFAYDPMTGVMTFTGITTLDNYEAILALVQYRVDGDNPTDGGAANDRTIAYSVFDGLLYSDEVVATITVIGVDDVPVMDLNGASSRTGETLSYSENHAPMAIAPAAMVTDVDSGDFAAGTLTVRFVANGSLDDRLTIINVGTGAGEIGVSGNTVSFANVEIGTFAGGTDGSTPLIVTFGPDATPAAVQALTQAVAYSNVSDAPTIAARTVEYVVTDGDGGTGSPVSATVNLTAINDAPTGSGLQGDSVLFSEDGLPVRLDEGGDAAVADLDPSLYAARVVGIGLRLPLEVAAVPDGSGRVFVLQLEGRILILDPDTGIVNPTPFLDVSSEVSVVGEKGLLGFAIAPDFASSGIFYIFMSNPDGNNEVRRYRTATGNPDQADPSTMDVILTIPHPTAAHNGGWMGFGPDGNLYVGTGDGAANSFDAQDLNSLNGKILRLDVSHDDFADPLRDYAIPLDNPFAAGGGLGEIWASGLRNPYRASFDAVTGNLYIGDVGAAQAEEINLMRPTDGGVNFGWPIREGTFALNGPDSPTFTPPVAQYSHTPGINAVLGGYVYRGPIEALQNQYIFGDIYGQSFALQGSLWSVPADSLVVGSTLNSAQFTVRTAAFAPDEGRNGILTGMGVDEAGNLYLADWQNGRVVRIEDGADPNFAGGRLSIAITQNKVVGEDRLQIDVSPATTVTLSTGTNAGSEIRVGGALIGFIAAGGTGIGADNLVIDLTSGATLPRLDALLHALTYLNTNHGNPSESIRTITYTLVDGAGLANGGHDSVTFTSTVAVAGSNDAPTVATASSDQVTEDDPNPAGLSIAGRFAGHFTDPDGLGETINGIAIVGNDAEHNSMGDWQYSTDGGTIWFAVGAVSASAALVLDAAALLRFVPTGNYFGTPDGLSAHGLDATYAGAFTSGAGREAIDVSGGGTTAISNLPATIGTVVQPVNDKPVNVVPGSQAIDEDVPLTFSGGNAFSVGDPDVGAGNLTVTLSVSHGLLTLGATAGLSFSPGSDGIADATMNISGSQGAVNSALADLLYVPTGNYNGSDTLTITTNDNGNTGTDPGQTGGTDDEQASDSVAIDIAAVADAPDGTTATMIGTEDVVRILAPSEFGFTDADSGDILSAVTITGVAGGKLYFDSGGGPAEVSTFPQTYTAEDIAASHLSFLGNPNANGSVAKISFAVIDDSGAANAADPVANILTLDLTPVNDTPALSSSAPVATGEDSPPIELDPTFTVSDVDLDARNGGDGDYAGAQWLVANDGGDSAFDLFAIAAGDGFTVSGNQVLAGGFEFATFTGGDGAPLDILFTSTGTPATTELVNAVARAITYEYTGDNPPASVEVVFGLDDGSPGHGQGSNASPNPAAAYNIITVNIAPVDDPPVAQPDAVSTDETTVLDGNLLDDNGAGPDSDADGPLPPISAVNGDPDGVGRQVTLPSGALLTLGADGTFSYDPHHAFDATPAPGSGAANMPATDTFDYRLTGGGTASVTVTITGVDSDDVLLGTASTDTLNGGIGDDYLDGGSGADLLIGGAGDDIYRVDGEGDSVDEAIGGGKDTVFASANYRLTAGSEVELLQAGAAGAIDLTGNEMGNRIYGNDDANFLVGGGGDDVLAAFGGDDILYGDAGSDRLYGGAGADVLEAFGGADTLRGEGGDDYLDGGAGVDAMSGGAGDDIYWVDDAGDVVTDAVGEGRDTVFARTTYTLNAGAEVEVLAAGNSGALDLTGNELANAIYGNDAANLLIGGGGNDELQGFGGDDTLYGGAGNDYLDGGAGNDVLESFGGADTLRGGAGDDYLDGGPGADLMIGGTGDDSYWVDDAGDIVDEATGGGNDTLFARVSYTLNAGSEVEVLAAGVAGVLNLTGNELANALYGNDAANVLNGGGGNDVLAGFGGADTYAFTTALGAGNVDRVLGFETGTDKIALDHAVFAGLGLGNLSAGAFVTGSAAQDVDDRIIYDSNTGALYYDADGNGAGAAVQFATLDTGLTLTNGDLIGI